MSKKIDKSKLLFSNKALLLLIVPLIMEQILAVIIGMTDSAVVSRVGESAVSGVSLVDQIMILMIQVFAALATGGAVIAGQYLGQKNRERASEAATQLLYFIGAASLVITIILYLLQGVILKYVFGQITPEVMNHAKTYYMIVSASIPFIAIYSGGAAIFRAMGNSKVTMNISILMNIINIVGDLSLVLVFKLGVAGVGIPTLLSRALGAIIIVILLLNEKREVHIARTFKIRFNWRMIKSILRIGVPNGLENSMFQLGKILVLSLIATFGTSAITANAVSNVIGTFQTLPGLAIGLGMVAVISQCVGAGDYEQAKYYNKKLLSMSFLSITIMAILTNLSMPLFMKVYSLTEQTMRTTKEIIFFHSIFSALIWSLAFVLPATFRAAGDVKATMYISIFSMWVFRIGCSYLIGKYLNVGVLGVWFAMFIDWLFRSICFVIRYLKGSWIGKMVV
ncbi:MAG TPA: MATE family efflux transporter [Candidatus Dorea intestinavium]|nr:MATE family efflux transporter [Candidatus Dorea intestinavium]